MTANVHLTRPRCNSRKGRAVVVAGLGAFFLLGLSRPADAANSELDCTPPARGSLSVDDPQTAPTIPGLRGLDEASRLDHVIALFRAAGIRSIFAIDRIVAAYCRDVSSLPMLNQEEKLAKVRMFAQRLTAEAYDQGSESSILVDLALSPDMIAQIDDAAKRRSVSRQDWIKGAVTSALASNPTALERAPQ